MKTRIKRYEELSPIEFLILREKLGLSMYRKVFPHKMEEQEIPLNLAIKRIEDREKDDFIKIGYRKRRLKMPH